MDRAAKSIEIETSSLLGCLRKRFESSRQTSCLTLATIDFALDAFRVTCRILRVDLLGTYFIGPLLLSSISP